MVDRDFGFAPNPFHGICTLATCKPRIRNCAQVGDWVIGVGGKRLKATGKCIFAMQITEKITFNNYWSSPDFRDKKPVRNGSQKMIVGDNIYHKNLETLNWHQAHSHHSMPDGEPNLHNLSRDTQSEYVLISRHFYYFGQNALEFPQNLLDGLGYKNYVGHRVFDFDIAYPLVSWIENTYPEGLNFLLGDPYDFINSTAHYSVHNNQVTK